ncbi:MAG: type IV pilus biogenesis protein PilM [Terriglobales bacterium]
MAGNSTGRPRMACEIAANRVIAARASDDGSAIELHTSRPLAAGCVAPGLTASNVFDREGLRQAVRAVMDVVTRRSKDVIVVLPDAAVRVALLDFESLPEKESDAAALVRFRLRKTLPFDVEHAAVSYHVQRGFAAEGGPATQVVAAVAPQSVVEEYESALRESGYNPGVVMPSMVAALGVVDARRPTLVVKADAVTTTVAIVDQHQLRLIRTLENKLGTTGEQLAEEIYPSVVFFQDTCGADLERVLVGGQVPVAGLEAALETQTGLRVAELVGEREAGGGLGDSVPPAALAGVVGALVA